MTLKDFNEMLNRNIPVVSSGHIEKITILVAKFKFQANIFINYNFLEGEILKRTKRLHHKSAIRAFFVRLRAGDKFENLINRKELVGDGSKKTKVRPEPKSIKTKPSKKVSTNSASEDSAPSGPPKRAPWNIERIVIGIYKPGISHSETEEDPIHRK